MQRLTQFWRIPLGVSLGFGMSSLTIRTIDSGRYPFSTETVDCEKRFASLEEEAKTSRAEPWDKRWKRDGTRPGFHNLEVNKHLVEYLERVRREAGDKESKWNVLVPLCGKTVDMGFLESNGYNVVGVEFIQDAIDQFADEQGFTWQQPESVDDFVVFNKDVGSGLSIWKGDFFKFKDSFTSKNKETFNFVWDRAAMVAIQPVLRRQYADTIKAMGENMILVTFEYDQNEMDGPPFSVPTNEVYELYQDKYNITLVSRESIAKALPKLAARGISEGYENVFILTKKD
mmetsp:Transcript_16106/g.18239  ORF Transcript_16106/g.18239 Transcript_16106/m.18239 type:complete len:287 (-) Transcript_16106:1581-2441(-)|eukprot:CAMPEP_0184007842 /NCGR_PEP_ID=MMETSP0954-20121128/1593_1 /TAXON_ID=627963 /ORGANISM="Aplanochytrium sp, Strain PBS07" /LENGTH=286 /DNA_ID=CAMNT_0026286787 /DNA_START=86 /DNA_END=946 /DNA_ORIENTATION=+